MKFNISLKVFPLDEIIPAPYNPREEIIRGSDEYESLCRSLKEHGQVEPLVVNMHNMHCVGGNQRLTVMADMGWKDAICSVIDQPDILKEKKIAIALNRIKGRWDTDKLGDILRDDEVLEYETGLDHDEIMVYRHLEDVHDPDIDAEYHDSEENLDTTPDEDAFDDDGIEEEVEELMPDSEPKPTTIIRVGHVKFKCEVSLYKRLLIDIRDKGIFDEKKIAAEIKRRLLYND